MFGLPEMAYEGALMELQFCRRNHDMGNFFPTFQERVNNMLPAEQAVSAAPELAPVSKNGMTPHYPSEDEVNQTLAQVEQEAVQQSEELIQLHSGLNEERVARLLGLLD